MSIAAKCTCGNSPQYCTGGPGCRWINGKTLDIFFIENACNEQEKKQIKAFLFALRHNDVDFGMLENIIKKYSHLL